MDNKALSSAKMKARRDIENKQAKKVTENKVADYSNYAFATAIVENTKTTLGDNSVWDSMEQHFGVQIKDINYKSSRERQWNWTESGFSAITFTKKITIDEADLNYIHNFKDKVPLEINVGLTNVFGNIDVHEAYDLNETIEIEQCHGYAIKEINYTIKANVQHIPTWIMVKEIQGSVILQINEVVYQPI